MYIIHSTLFTYYTVLNTSNLDNFLNLVWGLCVFVYIPVENYFFSFFVQEFLKIKIKFNRAFYFENNFRTRGLSLLNKAKSFSGQISTCLEFKLAGRTFMINGLFPFSVIYLIIMKVLFFIF